LFSLSGISQSTELSDEANRQRTGRYGQNNGMESKQRDQKRRSKVWEQMMESSSLYKEHTPQMRRIGSANCMLDDDGFGDADLGVLKIESGLKEGPFFLPSNGNNVGG
jgi:hypothetical protein